MSEISKDAFHDAMRQSNLVALWEWNDARANRPTQSEPAHHWRWRDIEPVFDQAVAATDMQAAERRVVQLKNPVFPADYIAVTTNINCGFQILMPGERARPHRHNMNALRFIVEGRGATTIVDGKSCPMEIGDLILTPAMTWHEHAHEGDRRTVWMDSLDSPLVRHLRCVLFQPGPARDYPVVPPDSAFTRAGFAPKVTATSYSPVFRYAAADSIAALESVPAEPDGSRLLRYVNPSTGGAIMSLMDCYLLGLASNQETRPWRSTSNAACLVIEGEGVSRIDDETVTWQKYDLFTLPAWQWVTHKAAAPGARLFLVTDREILRRLELLRDEYAS